LEDSIADPTYHRQHQDKAKSIARNTTTFAKDETHTHTIVESTTVKLKSADFWVVTIRLQES